MHQKSDLVGAPKTDLVVAPEMIVGQSGQSVCRVGRRDLSSDGAKVAVLFHGEHFSAACVPELQRYVVHLHRCSFSKRERYYTQLLPAMIVVE